ncbi:MAG TPA: S8 family serine peptidase [Saprospiraceae bacterium]|nr:S8 family serine peptidase [Saprospiraceae bacterium]
MQKHIYTILSTSLFLIAISTQCLSQTNARSLATDVSYYYHDERIQPDIADGIVLVGLEDLKSSQTLPLRNAGLGIESYFWGHAVVKGPALNSNRGETMQQLLDMPGVTFVHPVFQFENGLNLSYDDELLLRLHDDKTETELIIYLTQHGWEIVKANQYRKGAYLIRSQSSSSEEYFSMARKLYESGLCRYAEPNFIGKAPVNYIPNDPEVPNQFTIDNAGIVYGGGAPGVVGADMRLEEAWNVTAGGCEDIVIAIIDDGVTLTHPDLVANLLPGYDATGGGSNGAHTSGDGHGTFCAGTAAAVGDNGIGVAGVAYNCRILPIRAYSTDSSNTSFFVDAFDWAWNNGADVLSNSWGWGSSSAIEDAIDDAIEFGRGGLGCVVLASSGNSNNPTTLGFPGRYGPVIAVGASNACDERKRAAADTTDCDKPGLIPDPEDVSCDSVSCWGSNYGNNLDVVAPGQYVRTTTTGAYGWFQGTSAACPNAAGVVALILSINPNLNQPDAREILEETCRRGGPYSYSQTVGHPNGDWNNEMGYGICNAQVAVQQALISASHYIQNITFGPFNYNYVARYQILAGSNVNNNAAPGPVTVSPGADVMFDAGWRVLLRPGFTATSGSEFEARIVNIAFCPIGG